MMELPEDATIMTSDQTEPGEALLRGNIGWVKLLALGVSYAIAGDYAAWNYGLGVSGWGGLMAAVVVMGIFYLCLMFCMAELATAIPSSGGGYAFVRRAFGRAFGFAVGLCIAIEYVMVTAVIGIFLSSYFEGLTGIGGTGVLVIAYALCLSMHLLGVGEALKIMLVLAIIGFAGIVIFTLVTLPHFRFAALVAGGGTVPAGAFPFGVAGIVAGLPFGMAFFLAVEGLPLASEEARDPVRDMPIAMILSWATLLAIGVILLFAAPGATGIAPLLRTDSPLIVAMRSVRAAPAVMMAVNIAGLIAIAASFFSAIYAYSRQLFALSRAGYLPRFLSHTNRRHAPWAALLFPGMVAFSLSLWATAEPVLLVAVFCATLSYLCIIIAFVYLRVAQPTLRRPYRAPGGLATAAVALVLAAGAFLASFLAAPLWSLIAAALIGGALLYYAVYARHHLARPVDDGLVARRSS